MKHTYPEYSAFEQCSKQRDLYAELASTKNRLEEEISALGYQKENAIFIDRQRNIQQKGKAIEYSYIAWYHKEDDGKTYLKCRVGFTQIGKEDSISISIHEIKKK